MKQTKYKLFLLLPLLLLISCKATITLQPAVVRSPGSLARGSAEPVMLAPSRGIVVCDGGEEDSLDPSATVSVHLEGGGGHNCAFASLEFSDAFGNVFQQDPACKFGNGSNACEFLSENSAVSYHISSSPGLPAELAPAEYLIAFEAAPEIKRDLSFIVTYGKRVTYVVDGKTQKPSFDMDFFLYKDALILIDAQKTEAVRAARGTGADPKFTVLAEVAPD